jgi:hypothetical protein
MVTKVMVINSAAGIFFRGVLISPVFTIIASKPEKAKTINKTEFEKPNNSGVSVLISKLAESIKNNPIRIKANNGRSFAMVSELVKTVEPFTPRWFISVKKRVSRKMTVSLITWVSKTGLNTPR